MGHTYTKLFFHIVFSTHQRRLFLQADLVRPKVHAYLSQTARILGGGKAVGGGYHDHVHILMESNPSLAISKIVRDIKTASSKWIKASFPGYDGFAWQEGYSAFTVSASNYSAVEKYIMSQEKHHGTSSFQDELLGLLAKHGIEYDEQYLWT